MGTGLISMLFLPVLVVDVSRREGESPRAKVALATFSRSTYLAGVSFWHTLKLGGGQSVSALPQESDVNLFGDSEGVIHLDTQVADSALDFAMAKQELNGPEVPRPPIDQGRLGSSQ